MEEEVRTLLDGYWGIQDEIKQAQEHANSVLRELAEKLSPVKVGDVVVINGYVHQGKKMLVKTIRAEIKNWKNENVIITAIGDVIKKDGLPGMNTAENFYRFDIK